VGILSSILSRLALQREAVSSSPKDAFPYLRSLRYLDPEPAGEDAVAELRREGGLRLGPGTYEFEVQSFCLDAGRFGPDRGSRYLLAPMKGRRAGVVSGLLQGAGRHPDVTQEDLQSLICAIASGARYRSLPDHLRATAELLLPEGAVLLLGKSYWHAIPAPLRGLLLDLAKSILPPHLVEAAQRLRQTRDRIVDAAASYSDLERTAIRLGSPPPAADERGRTPARSTRGGEWSLVGAFLMRAVPQGYRRTKLQVYVPERRGLEVARDNLGRIAKVRVPAGPGMEIIYGANADSSLPLRGGSPLKVWRFERLRFLTPEQPPSNGDPAELEVAGWIPHAPEKLAGLDEGVESDLSERILLARDVVEDGHVLRRVAPPQHSRGGAGGEQSGEKPPGSSDPMADITDVGHYFDGVEAVLKDLLDGVEFGEKMKWLKEHVRRLLRAYNSALTGLTGQIQKTEQDLEFSCPSELVAVSDKPHEQRLGFRCGF